MSDPGSRDGEFAIALDTKREGSSANYQTQWGE